MPLIELTDTEITHLLDALHERTEDLRGVVVFANDASFLNDQIAELNELADDLREALNRQDDGWGEAHVEAQFIQSGIDAREQQKATSRAQARRDLLSNTRVLSGKE